MQLAFVCLLMAQNFSGFNQWKQLVQLLCSCPELIEEKPDMFVEFIGNNHNFLPKSNNTILNSFFFFIDVLQLQLDECPEDFYRDILSENNFTSVMLRVKLKYSMF
jgi:A1 cistron-splicing factor AAR2